MTLPQQSALPPGQKEFPSFDRFGLGRFANRFPREISPIALTIEGDISNPVVISEALFKLNRVTQVSNFHCVTTWSVQNLHWSGFRFSDFFHEIIVPLAKPEPSAEFIIFRGQDGYSCSMLLADLLAEDVLLADTLNGEPLGIDHGAPIRLVAPAHYGYKNVKHIHAIEFRRDGRHYRFPLPYPDLINHPRARVALEERARILPNWVIRPLYKFLQPFARRKHGRMLNTYLSTHTNVDAE